MHLVVVGLNYRTAPVEIREKLSVPEEAIPDALADLRSASPVSECLILSTCNRTEICACTDSRADDASIISWMVRRFGVPAVELTPHLYSHAGHKAAEHIFRVASGIDSMVLGEAQVLSQVKLAYAVASKGGFTDSVLNSLFQQAISVGKRARTETDIGKGAFSVGSVAVQLAGSIFDRLSGRTVLIVGAGKMSELTMTHLVSAGASDILVANRTPDKAVGLASQFGGRAIGFDEIIPTLNTADIVITSTGSREPIIDRRMMTQVHHSRRGKPIFFIDMAVPRDIEPAVGDLDNVFLYNIDDLQSVVASATAERRSEVDRVEEIVAAEVQEFLRWFRAMDAVPIITALRDKFDEIRTAEFEKLMGRLPDLSPEQQEAVNAAMRSVVNKICHQPMIQIKDYTADGDCAAKLETICEVFGICPTNGRKATEPDEEQST